jgi:hypothetical protein
MFSPKSPDHDFEDDPDVSPSDHEDEEESHFAAASVLSQLREPPPVLAAIRAADAGALKPKPSHRFRRAVITSFDMDLDPMTTFDPAKYCYINFQKETCPSTSRQHWQIYIEKKSSQGFLSQKSLKTLFGASCHIKFVDQDNGASTYCFKDASAVEGTRREACSEADAALMEESGPNSIGVKLSRVKGFRATQELTFEAIQQCATWDEVLQISKVAFCMQWARDVFQRKTIGIDLPPAFADWRPWQAEEFEAIELQDDRKIRYIVDYVGGAGKSVFAKRMITERKAFYCNGGKKADIIHAYEGQEYVVFDLSRSIDQQFWPYQVMEEMKNGLAFSGKYNSTTKRFKPAKIVVLTNEDPDLTKHSADRWSFRYLSERPCVFNFQQAEEKPMRPLLKRSRNTA